MDGWNILDALALIVLVVSMLGAIRKGLSVELVSLASVLAGFLAAAFSYSTLGAFLVALGVPERGADLVGFVTIFAFVFILGAVLSATLDRVLKGLYLKWLDRLLGGAFGLLRGCLVVAIVFLSLTAFPVHKELVSNSLSAGFFLEIGRAVVTLTPGEFKDKFHSGYRRLQQIWRERGQL